MKNTIINTVNLHSISLTKPRIWSTKFRYEEQFENIVTETFYTVSFIIEDVNDKL